MNSQTLSILVLIFILILDLLNIAARSGFRSSTLARLLQFRDQNETKAKRTIGGIEVYAILVAFSIDRIADSNGLTRLWVNLDRVIDLSPFRIVNRLDRMGS